MSVESFTIDIKKVASKLQISEHTVSSKIKIAAQQQNTESEQRASSSGPSQPRLGVSPPNPAGGSMYIERKSKKGTKLSFGVPKMASTAPTAHDAAQAFLLGSSEAEYFSSREGSAIGASPPINGDPDDFLGAPYRDEAISRSVGGNSALGSSAQSEPSPETLIGGSSVSSNKSNKRYTLLDTIDAKPGRTNGPTSESDASPLSSSRTKFIVHKSSDAMVMTVEEAFSPVPKAARPRDEDGTAVGDLPPAASFMSSGSDVIGGMHLSLDSPVKPRRPGLAVSFEDDKKTDLQGGSEGVTERLLSDPQTTYGGASPPVKDATEVDVDNGSLVAVSSSKATPKSTGEEEAKQQKKKKRDRHVHFPEDAVKQITVVQRDEQLFMQVEYSRPVWTWVAMLGSCFTFALAWMLLCRSAYPSDFNANGMGANTSVAKVVSLYAFIMYAGPAVLVPPVALLTWRPSRFEKRMARTRRTQLKILVCAVSYGVQSALLTGAFMCVLSAANGATYAVVPVVGVYAWELWRERIVAIQDTLGTLLVIAGIIILGVGEERQNRGAYLHWIGLALSLLAAVFKTLFTITHRRLRTQVGNGLLMASTTFSAGIFVTLITAGVGGFSAVVGSKEDSHGLMGLEGSNLARAVACGVLMTIFTTVRQYIAVYFDTISMTATLSLVGPLMILLFHQDKLPHMVTWTEISGGATIVVGVAVVVFAGYRHRRHVELAINTEV